MERHAYRVGGMSCDHCVRAVTAELATLTAVVEVEVELESGRVTVVSDAGVDRSAVAVAIDAAGCELAS